MFGIRSCSGVPAACASAILICLRMKSRSERTRWTPGTARGRSTRPAAGGVTGGGAGTATTGVVGAENTCSVTPCASCVDRLHAQRQAGEVGRHPEAAPLALSNARSPPGSRMMSSNTPEPAHGLGLPRVADRAGDRADRDCPRRSHRRSTRRSKSPTVTSPPFAIGDGWLTDRSSVEPGTSVNATGRRTAAARYA